MRPRKFPAVSPSACLHSPPQPSAHCFMSGTESLPFSAARLGPSLPLSDCVVFCQPLSALDFRSLSGLPAGSPERRELCCQNKDSRLLSEGRGWEWGWGCLTLRAGPGSSPRGAQLRACCAVDVGAVFVMHREAAPSPHPSTLSSCCLSQAQGDPDFFKVEEPYLQSLCCYLTRERN